MIRNHVHVVALLAICVLAIGCTPKPLEEPDAGVGKKAAKAEPPPNPFASLTAQLVGSHDKAATYVAFSPDGRLLVSTGKDKLIRLWDLTGAQPPRALAGHEADVMMADFSADGARLVSASWDESARVWDAASGKQLQVLKEKPPPKRKLTEEEEAALLALPKPQVNWAAFHPEGDKVITASDDFALKLWDLRKGEKLLVYKDDGCRQNRVYRRLDGAGWVSSAGCVGDGISYLKFWDDSGNQAGAYGDENRDAHYLAFDHAGRFLVAADGSMALSIYSAQGSYLKRVLVGTYHFCLAFGPGDETLLVGADNGSVIVYETEGWTRIGRLDAGERSAVDGLALSPTDDSLALALRSGKIMRFTTPVRAPKGSGK